MSNVWSTALRICGCFWWQYARFKLNLSSWKTRVKLDAALDGEKAKLPRLRLCNGKEEETDANTLDKTDWGLGMPAIPRILGADVVVLGDVASRARALAVEVGE